MKICFAKRQADQQFFPENQYNENNGNLMFHLINVDFLNLKIREY